jgi:hypothetical protein
MADNTMTNTLGDSAAGCGLCLSYFKIAFDRGGVDGVQSIFCELNLNGKTFDE